MVLKRFLNDTIAAQATPHGISGIAVLRISGRDALSIALKLSNLKKLKPRLATFSKIIDPHSGHQIDNGIFTLYKAPHSYTGDDTVEISCHGGEAIPHAILQVLISQGARMALPGEFTRKAFSNGKLDLLQAESVADIIHSNSRRGSEISQRILKGRLSEVVLKIKRDLTDIASTLELELDFNDQEIEKTPSVILKESIILSQIALENLLTSYKSGKIQREGVIIPIVGEPNAGKSSLLNALLKKDRAIISDIPGTTRDTIEEQFFVDGIAYRLIDTAGIHDAKDKIEKLGVGRTYKILNDADIILLILDGSRQDDFAFEKSFILNTNTPIILAINKSDILNINGALENKIFSPLPKVQISAKFDSNLDELVLLISQIAEKEFGLLSESISLTHLRHVEAVEQSIESLLKSIHSLEDGLSQEFIAMDLRESIDHLSALTGETTSEDILNNIFSQFCIGK